MLAVRLPAFEQSAIAFRIVAHRAARGHEQPREYES
jgi:hypothetical protein